MKKLITGFLVVIPFLLSGQLWRDIEFIASPENESLVGLEYLPNGGLVASGVYSSGLDMGGILLESMGAEDIYAVLFDHSGQATNSFSLGGGNEETLIGMATTASSDIAFFGGYFSSTLLDTTSLTPSFSNQGLFLCLSDTLGNVKWARTIEGRLLNVGGDIATDESGNIYICGYFSDTLKIGNEVLAGKSDEGDMFVARFNSIGELIWMERAGLEGITRARDIALDEDGNIIIGGTFKGKASFSSDTLMTNTATHDVFVCKLNPSGVFLWGKKLGGVWEKEFGGLALDGQQIFLTGNYVGVMSDNEGWSIQTEGFNQAAYLIGLEPSGNLAFGYSFGGTDDDFPTDIAIRDGKIALTGYFNGTTNWSGWVMESQGNFNSFLALFDLSGNIINLNPIHGNDFTIGKRVRFKPDGDICLGGDFRGNLILDEGIFPSDGDYDVFLIKPDRTVPIKNTHDIPRWNIYPNPVKDIIIIEHTQEVEFSIVNSEGKKIMHISNGENNVSQLETGWYFISQPTSVVSKFFKL